MRARMAAAAAAVGAVAFVAYGGGFPNRDASWTLVWGRELLHLETPSYAAGSTPHPLANLIGVAAEAAHPASEAVLQAVGYLAVGALIVGVFALARELFGTAAGVLAAVLVATRDTLLFNGALAYVDVIYAALVVWAVALEAERPRRGVPVLAVLAVAGLVRPEAWVLAAVYWWYARPPDTRVALRWAALVVAPPLLWALHDLVFTGDPAFSFTATREATPRSGLPTGLDAVLTEGPRAIVTVARPDVCLVALAGLAVAWRIERFWLLFGSLVATTAATAIPVIAGTPLNDRYLIATMALLCVAAAAPLALLTTPRARLVAGACIGVLVVGAAFQAPRLRDRRADVVDRDARRTAAHELLDAGLPCRPVVVPNNRMIPLAASWLDLPLSDVVDGRDGTPPGSYVSATPEAAENLLVIENRPGGMAPAPSAPVVRRDDGWTLMARCDR